MCSGILVLAAPSNGSNDGIDHPDQSITIGKPITDDEIQTAGQLPPGYGEQVSGNAGLTNNGTEKPEGGFIHHIIISLSIMNVHIFSQSHRRWHRSFPKWQQPKPRKQLVAR